MAISVTALGTKFDPVGSNVVNLDPLARDYFPINSFIVFCTASDNLSTSTTVRLMDSVTSDYVNFDGTLVSVNNSGNVATHLIIAKITSLPNGTSTIIPMHWYSSWGHWATSVYIVSGLADSPLDKSSTGTGTDAPYNTGSTGTLSQANELAIAVIGIEEQTDNLGSWTTGSGYVSGNEQSTGETSGGAKAISIATAAMVVSATTALQGDMNASAPDWAALIATFKEASTNIIVSPSAVSSVASKVDPTVVCGSVSIAPAEIVSSVAVIVPDVVLGSVSVEPAVASSAISTINPDISIETPPVTPAAVSSGTGTTAPTVVIAWLPRIFISQELVEIGWKVATPTIRIGSLTVEVGYIWTGASKTITPDVAASSASTVDPTVYVGSGPILVEPTPVSVVGVSLSPEVILGSVAVDPAPSQSVAQSVAPSVAFGSLIISPASAESATATLIEALALGSLTLELSALSSSTATIYPEVLLGSLTLEPPALYSVADVVNPTVSIPSSTVEPSPASSGTSAIPPTVTYGSLELITSPASVSSAVSLEVVLGSLALAPQPAASATQSVFPTVVAGSVSLSCSPATCAAISSLQEAVLGSLTLESQSASAGTSVALSDIVHGSLLLPPEPATVATSIVAPDILFGSTNVSPTPVTAACLTVVEVGTSSVIVTPSPSYSSTVSLLDFAIQGSVTIEPAATTLSSVALDPTVVFGNISITTAAAQCPAQALPPQVVLGTLSIEPVAVATVASSINPETHQGSLTFTVIVATSSSIVYPTVVLSSTSVADVVASAATSTINPDIPLGSTVVTPSPVIVSSISINPSVFAGNQFSRPYIDYTNNGWKNELDQSTNLYESINEVTPSDSDYIVATHGATETSTVLQLQALEDPEVHALHKMRFRYKVDGTPQYGFFVSLYQGDTQIAEWSTYQEASDYVDVEVELTEGQVASITDYSLLNVRFVTAGTP